MHQKVYDILLFTSSITFT